MSIVKCPECGHDVSSKAAACPNCGAPVAQSPLRSDHAAPHGKHVQTIERTSKSYKTQYLLSWTIGIACIIGALASGGTAETWFILGWVLCIFWYIAARIGAWWDNG